MDKAADLDVGLSTLVDPAQRPRAGSFVQDQFDIDSPWHHHDMHQLQYAFEGSMELEDESGRHLLPRSLAGWIPAGTRHRNSLHRIRSASVLIAPDLVPNAGSGIAILRVSPLMREMIAESLRWPLNQPHDETGAAFFAAFARFCGEWIADRAPLSLPSTADRQLDLALAHVRTDPADARMDRAAREAGLSERSLRRRCQAQLGMGWDEYRRRARLLASIDALGETDRSIAQIAADVGFESQSAFARAFRQLTGLAPQEFRVQSRR
jgi:AraC-like DNA-binding protein